MKPSSNLVQFPSRRLLVVDDEPSITESLVQIFGYEGFEVRQASTGNQALKQLVDWQPDCALVDVLLPDISGLELARQIRQSFPTCRLILFSGHLTTLMALEKDREEGLDFEVFQKPVSPGVLIAAIRASH